MDLELLRTFLEVNRLRHFGRAAEVLHLTQAAVSARIKQLESQLDVTLFVRQYHDLQLTAEGHRLVRHADLLISGWRKARQEVVMGGAKQQLTFGGSLRIWDIVLQDWFLALRMTLPELAIIAEVHSPDLLTRRMLDGHLDLAFMLEPPQMELLQVKKVAEIELVMISASPGLNALQALEDQYIMVDWGLAQALEHRRLFPDAPEPQLRVAKASMAVLHMLNLGGSAYVPARMVANELESQQLFLVDQAPPIKQFAYAMYPIRSPKSALIKTALSHFEYKVDLDFDALLEDQPDPENLHKN